MKKEEIVLDFIYLDSGRKVQFTNTFWKKCTNSFAGRCGHCSTWLSPLGHDILNNSYFWMGFSWPSDMELSRGHKSSKCGIGSSAVFAQNPFQDSCSSQKAYQHVIHGATTVPVSKGSFQCSLCSRSFSFPMWICCVCEREHHVWVSWRQQCWSLFLQTNDQGKFLKPAGSYFITGTITSQSLVSPHSWPCKAAYLMIYHVLDT